MLDFVWVGVFEKDEGRHLCTLSMFCLGFECPGYSSNLCVRACV